MTTAWHLDRAQLQAAFTEQYQEGQGVWDMAILKPENVPERALAACNGDEIARQQMDAVDHTLVKIEAIRRRQDGMLCLLCDNSLWRDHTPGAVVIVCAHERRTSPALVNALCVACVARHGASLLSAVQAYYHENVVKNLRVLPPITEAGRA